MIDADSCVYFLNFSVNNMFATLVFCFCLNKVLNQLNLAEISKSSKKLDRIKAIGEAGIARKMENAADMIWQDKEDFPEYNHRSSSRKSLAWDSAFFTSPGKSRKI